MALLQISEPGESPAPHERKLAVGIDLGTTHSLVAAVRSSIPEILPDAQGRHLLPSAVRYVDAQSVEVGFEALTHRASGPLNTLVSIKRLMGRSAAEAPVVSSGLAAGALPAPDDGLVVVDAD